MDLNATWFILIGVLLVGYAILDGFDLGAGILQLFIRSEEEKKNVLTAIGPFWDGNEVWLLTGGGAIFAAFPHVYATVFSGFYLALMLLLVALIFRAVSIEFRNQVATAGWQRFWDLAFSLGSLVAALLLGVALGNIFVGVPLDQDMNYAGSFFTLLRPVPLLVGLTGVCMIVTQGGTYLQLKTTGDLQRRLRTWTWRSWVLFVILVGLTTVVIAMVDVTRIQTLFGNVFGYLAVILLAAGVILLPVFLKREQPFKAFLSSSAIIAAMFLIVGATIFPNLVPALNPAHSLTIYNAASSQLTLTVMLVIALIGMPIVIAYTVFVHHLFRKP